MPSLSRDIVAILFAVASALTGFLGLIIHSYYGVNRPPSGFVRDHFIAVWPAALTFIAGANLIFHSALIRHERRNEPSLKTRRGCCGSFLVWHAVLVWALACVGAVVAGICYAIYARQLAAPAWHFVLAVVSASIVGVVADRIKLAKTRSKVEPEKTTPGGARTCGLAGRTAYWIFSVFNGLIITWLPIFSALTVYGGINHASGIVRYPPRGQFMTVPFINDPSGRTVQIHYLCSGPINNSFPVIFWEADITHGMSDFWGLQMTFADAGYRSCVWDKLGQGYSDYYFFDTTSQYQDQYYHNFISMLTEKKPMIFASWSGGAGSQYQYALQHPENVHSMLFIDVAPFGIEWEMERVFKNLTAQQTAEYKRIDRLGRNAIFGILRALGVPWGLSTIFVPPPTPGSYKPADRVDEYRWFYITEKTWTSQFFLLDEYFNDTNNPYAISLPTTSTISINNLMVRQNTSTLTAVRCTGPIAVGSAACSDQVARDVYLQDKKVELWRNLTSNLARPGNLSFCTDETCKGDSFVLRNPAMTLREFKRIYAGVSIP